MSSSKPDSLKARALRAGGWTIVGFGFGQIMRLGSTLVMTRLLVPEMFGVMAIATVVTVLINLLSDIGLRQSIVQSRNGDSPAFLDTAWVLQIIRGFACWALALLLCVVLYFTSQAGLFPDKSVYSLPILPQVIAATSFSAVILGFESTKVATAYRKFEQKRIIQIELIGQLTALATMIGIGLLTHSIWALVVGGLISPLTTTILSHVWMNGHPNRARWDKESANELLHFGKWVLASSALFVFASIGDRMLLGFFVEPGMLGMYAIASQLVSAIQAGPNKLFSTVTLPTLAEVARREPNRLREVYYKNRIPVDLAMLFLMGFVFATANLVIDLLYDSRYAGAGEILRILAVSLFAIRYGVASQIYLAIGIPRYVTITSAVRVVALYALVPVLYYTSGAHAALWGIAVHAVAMVPFIYYFNARHKLNDWRREMLVLLAIPLGYVVGAGLEHLWHWNI